MIATFKIAAIYMEQTDIIIIGAGPGGYEAAVSAAREGKKVVIVEARALGGTCLNEGCIPTKCLCRHAELYRGMLQAGDFGLSCETPRFDWTKIMERKEKVVNQLIAGIEQLMKTPGIRLVHGKARFRDAHTVEIEESGETFSAPCVIIAVGSESKCLPIEGAHLPQVVTSRELLNVASVPRRLCIIGGGVIGLEFASIFNTFGSEVTVVEYCKEILPNFDRDMAKRLRTSLKKRGISFKTGAAVTGIRAEQGGACTVCYEEKGKSEACVADMALMAVGRAPRLDALNLDDIGIAYTRRGITVDENMQTSVPGIYAVGDVNGLCQLAHAATYQSYRALHHIFGKTDSLRLDIIPSAVFTTPEVAAVGLTEEACSEQGLAVKTWKSFYRANGKALSMGEDEGIVKIISDESGRILGGHILGAHAADLIHEVAAFMNQNGSVQQMKDMVHAHPTLSEMLANLA